MKQHEHRSHLPQRAGQAAQWIRQADEASPGRTALCLEDHPLPKAETLHPGTCCTQRQQQLPGVCHHDSSVLRQCRSALPVQRLACHLYIRAALTKVWIAAAPHMGSAYSTISADTLARFQASSRTSCSPAAPLRVPNLGPRTCLGCPDYSSLIAALCLSPSALLCLPHLNHPVITSLRDTEAEPCCAHWMLQHLGSCASLLSLRHLLAAAAFTGQASHAHHWD